MTYLSRPDPCYLSRHNNVYAPPRELISVFLGVEYREMERSEMTSFCCGVGRMWMEERLSTRINLNRIEGDRGDWHRVHRNQLPVLSSDAGC